MNYQEVLDLINTKLASNAKIPASKHRTVETALLNYIEDSLQTIENKLQTIENKLQTIENKLPKNRGYFVTENIPNTNATYQVGGDIVSATRLVTTAKGIHVRCTMANAMANTNYKVIFTIHSLFGLENDNNIYPLIFNMVSTTQFDVYVEEVENGVQNISVHMDVIQL